jgi:hypothetical protein
MGGWMGGWMDGWMDGWVDGWMDGWMDGYLHIALLKLLPHLIIAIKYILFKTRYLYILCTYTYPDWKLRINFLFAIQDKLPIIVSVFARIWTTEGSQDCLSLATPTLPVAVGPGPSRGRQQTAARPVLGTFETRVPV